MSLVTVTESAEAESNELVAAAALTSLFSLSRASPDDAKHAAQAEEEQSVTASDEEEEEFVIPQRFTKSGRERAIPFPLKVSKNFMDQHDSLKVNVQH